MHAVLLRAVTSVTAATIACASPQSPPVSTASVPFAAPDLPRLAGQLATCNAPREKAFNLEAREAELDFGLGIRFMAWVYNGTLPGPTLEVCEDDHVTITVANHGEVSHGLDSHALRTDMMHFGPAAPGATLTIEKDVDTPGVFMYHCAAGPVTDVHIKSGLYGAMIVYPRDEPLRPARELVIVESAIFGDVDAEGVVPGTDTARAQRNDPTIMLFNGRLEHTPLTVSPGELVRAYVVNVGPGTSAMHVMGTILDTVHDGASQMRNVQTYGIPAGSGAIVEFRIPEPGMYGLVDHDRLAYLPYGMVVTFDAGGPSHDSD